MSLVVRVGAVSVAAVLAALSAALILSFGISAIGQPEGMEKVFKVIVATAAGFAFFLVGRSIWRDIRRRPSTDSDGKSAEKRER